MNTIRKRWMQFISMLLAFVLLSESFLGSGNIVLASILEQNAAIQDENNQGILLETVEAANEQTLLPEEEDNHTENLDILFEMEENRAQSSKHFRLSDGSIMAADYGMDIHYQKNGEWEDIDNRFVYEAADATDPMEGFATAEGDVEFKFAPDSSDGEVVKTVYEDYAVSFEFLGSFTEPDAEDEKITEALTEQTGIMEETAVLADGDLPENDKEQAEPDKNMAPSNKVSSRPITFVKGELLNMDEAMQALTGTPAEDVLALLEETEAQDIQDLPAVSTYLTGGNAETGDVIFSDNDPEAGTDKADIWAETGAEKMDESEKGSLTKQAALKNAVTSVGYEDVLDGVSLQYVTAGSSLKEYILVSEPQDTYEYLFAVNLDNLIPASQSDGSILLLDEESGETVYEIPAAYMTDAAGAYSGDVWMDLEKESDGRYLLRITADKDWLSEDARVFPVKIDPTLNKLLSSTSNIRGNYVKSLKPTETSTNYGEMYVGYDSSGNGNMTAYIQLRNLETLPKDSVICAAMFNMAVLSYSQVAWPKLYIQAKEVTSATTWSSKYSYNSRPAVSSSVLDHRAVTNDSIGKYVPWNITELVKKHYDEGNVQDDIFAFSLEASGTMSNSKCANTALNLLWDGGEPILQILYRDTRGVEDYYSYQTQSAGYAGTAYVGDYTSQLTVVKPLVSYSSTSMPYELGMVYNTAYSDGYFTNGGDTHSKNFTNMILGKGWKLTAQETVVPVSVTDMQGTASYLVHNDSDGTEHYFKETSSGSGQYEDEDGLNLTITKSGSSYTMTDKKSNKKYFKNGCLTYVEDANGNKIHIVYNNGTYSSNTINATSANRITSIVSEPKSGTVKKLFDLAYDSSLLSSITSYNDHAIDNLSKKIEFGYTGDSTGKYQLTQISRRAYVKPDENTTGAWGSIQSEAQYSYYDDSVNGNHRMKRIYDAENRYGIEYSHIKSDTGFRVYAWHEYTAASVNATQTTGAKVRTWNTQLRQTRYRDAGEDRILTDAADPTAVSDDVVTTYFFNSSGQTINARSETHQGDLLGVSASAYTKNSSTNTKKNNRISENISSGQAGVNIIENGGMEIDTDSDGTADGWADYVSFGSAVCVLDDSNTVGANYSGKRHYELTGNSTSAVSSIFQDIDVVQGNTYTFSTYVNTRGVTAFAENDGSIYLYVRRSSDQSLQAESIHLANVTEEKLDNGWQRLSATFTAERTEKLRFTICSYHTAGKVLVDDVQIEKGSAASRFNHVVNGSFEKAGNNWTVSTNKTGTLTVRTDAHIHGNVSLLMAPVSPETSMCAAQTIPLNKSSDTTFLLSAWSMGDSIPDLESEIAGKTDVSLRYWGLTLTLNYADGTKDEYNLPFCDYATNWQYAAMSVTPKCTTTKIIKTADLKIYYQNNANAAYFDNISLIEEPAQTYKYDDKGNLKSVKSSGNGEDGYEYDSNQNLMKVATEGSGDYEYKYENSVNKHLPTKIINDTVTMGLDYDANGQTIKTTLSNSKDSLSMTSYAAYNDGLMTSVTDNTGAVTTYGYDVRRRTNMVKDADDTSDTAVRTNYDDVWDRVSGTYIYNVVSVGNTYANGNLTNIARNGYHNGTKYTQNYDYAYDSFGNLTRMSIGGVRIADYGYNSGNGSLDHIYYGFTTEPAASVSYGYDPLGRMVTESWYDSGSRKSKVYGYNYSSDGNLAGISENGEPTYSYDYDSLGRLIQSSRIEDGKRVLYTDHQYDTSDRILSQSWQIGDKGWEEAYTYNDKDGTLSQMTVTGGDKLTFGYDNLKRLSSKTLINEQSGGTSLLKVDYGYHTEGNSTTTQIETMRFTKPDNASVARIPQLTYSYDAVGNITKVLSGSSILAEYTYDSRGQLLSEDDGKYYTTYTYDTYGNIRSAWVRASEDHTFVYGVYNYTYNDNGLWKDQLKGYSYQNYYGDISSFSGNLTYDVLGNPLTYFNGNKTWNFTWQYGRQLASASDGTHTITNEYDVDGVRESKTVDGVKHDYITLDGKIIRETYGNTTVDYFYDNEGKPYKLQVSEGNGTYTGYYILNQQGDVIAILNANGVKVVSYEYNAWGKVVDEASYDSITGPLFLEHNSLKYRGYYYDADLGLYYLGSRFYDQNICRFVNADTTDVLMANPSSLTDKNLYSYCDNNPVMRKDDDGEFWNIAAGAIIGGVISAGVELGTQLLTTGKVDLISIGIAAAGGALSGALASTSFGKVRQVVGNAVISGLSEAASQWKDGNRDIVSIAKNAGAMAFVGGISGVIGDPGIKAKGTTYRKSLDTLSSVKNNISKALSNPKGYRHQINSAIKKHISVSRTAVKNTTKSFVKATIFGNIVGKFKSWFRR